MDLGQLVATYGPYGAAVVVLLGLLYRDRERDRTRADAREKELKDELKTERSLNGDLTAGAFKALDTVGDLTIEVREQRPLQNEILRQITELSRRVERMEGQR